MPVTPSSTRSVIPPLDEATTGRARGHGLEHHGGTGVEHDRRDHDHPRPRAWGRAPRRGGRAEQLCARRAGRAGRRAAASRRGRGPGGLGQPPVGVEQDVDSLVPGHVAHEQDGPPLGPVVERRGVDEDVVGDEVGDHLVARRSLPDRAPVRAATARAHGDEGGHRRPAGPAPGDVGDHHAGADERARTAPRRTGRRRPAPARGTPGPAASCAWWHRRGCSRAGSARPACGCDAPDRAAN